MMSGCTGASQPVAAAVAGQLRHQSPIILPASPDNSRPPINKQSSRLYRINNGVYLFICQRPSERRPFASQESRLRCALLCFEWTQIDRDFKIRRSTDSANCRDVSCLQTALGPDEWLAEPTAFSGVMHRFSIAETTDCGNGRPFSRTPRRTSLAGRAQLTLLAQDRSVLG